MGFVGVTHIHTSVFFIEIYDDAGEEEDNKADRIFRDINFAFSDDCSPICFGIVGSCNGLLCLANSSYGYPRPRIYLYNPFTKTFKLLPKNHLIIKVDCRDESNKSVLGFGYNLSARDYTVVSVDYMKISEQEEKTKTNAYVYTLKSNTWKRAENVPVHRFGKKFPGGVLAGGRLHWLRNDKWGIVSFDLADNFFREVEMDLQTIVKNSVHPLTRRHFLHIAVLGGCLSLAVDDSFQIVIWGMREKNGDILLQSTFSGWLAIIHAMGRETNAEKSAKFEDFLSSLPQEIKAGILSRLPLKTVAQSRAVCPAWNLSHGDPSLLDMLISCKFALNRTWVFMGVHRIHTSVFFTDLYDDAGEEEDNKADRIFREINLPFSDDCSPSSFGIVGSCNGLLCLAYSSYPRPKIYLYNPFTKTFKLLPKNHLISKVDCRDESYKSVFGFGYNPSARDYTVVSVDYMKIYEQEEKTNAYVYTFKSNTWKRAKNVPVHRFRATFAGGVLASGRLHWFRDDNLGIVSFDLADNFFREVEMDLPMIVKNSVHPLSRRNFLHIAVLGGYLSLAVDDGCPIMIWGMREYGVKESWARMYTLGGSFYEEYTYFGGWNCIRVLGLRKNGDILLAIQLVGLVSYNPRDRAVSCCEQFVDVVNHFCTLVPIILIAEVKTGDLVCTKMDILNVRMRIKGLYPPITIKYELKASSLIEAYETKNITRGVPQCWTSEPPVNHHLKVFRVPLLGSGTPKAPSEVLYAIAIQFK
ncbi:F-box family protein, partial [Striga asiatica]